MQQNALCNYFNNISAVASVRFYLCSVVVGNIKVASSFRLQGFLRIDLEIISGFVSFVSD